jgi:flagellar basal-body rod protein FlgB
MSNMIQKIVVEDSTIKNYSKLLDLASLQSKLVAANIANAETPGYQKRTFDFDSALKKSMEKPRLKSVETNPRHIPLGDSDDRPPKIKQVKSTVNSTGINSVDIDQEMSDLAQNQIIYQYGSKMLQKKFNALKDVIKSK